MAENEYTYMDTDNDQSSYVDEDENQSAYADSESNQGSFKKSKAHKNSEFRNKETDYADDSKFDSKYYADIDFTEETEIETLRFTSSLKQSLVNESIGSLKRTSKLASKSAEKFVEDTITNNDDVSGREIKLDVKGRVELEKAKIKYAKKSIKGVVHYGKEVKKTMDEDVLYGTLMRKKKSYIFSPMQKKLYKKKMQLINVGNKVSNFINNPAFRSQTMKAIRKSILNLIIKLAGMLAAKMAVVACITAAIVAILAAIVGSVITIQGYPIEQSTIVNVSDYVRNHESNILQKFNQVEQGVDGYESYTYTFAGFLEGSKQDISTGIDSLRYMSYLVAKYEDFTFDNPSVRSDVEAMLNYCYQTEDKEYTTTRYEYIEHSSSHTEVDADGNEFEVDDSWTEVITIIETHYDYYVKCYSLNDYIGNNLSEEAADIYQIYLENQGCMSLVDSPVPYDWGIYVLSRIGNRIADLNNGTRLSYHNGIDILMEPNTFIKSGIKGTVIKTGGDPIIGSFVTIRSEDGTTQVTYGKLNSIYVNPGDSISSGKQIGNSTGCLYVEITENGKLCNPEFALERKIQS